MVCLHGCPCHSLHIRQKQLPLLSDVQSRGLIGKGPNLYKKLLFCCDWLTIFLCMHKRNALINLNLLKAMNNLPGSKRSLTVNANARLSNYQFVITVDKQTCHELNNQQKQTSTQCTTGDILLVRLFPWSVEYSRQKYSLQQHVLSRLKLEWGIVIVK